MIQGLRELYRGLMWAGREYPGGHDLVRRKAKEMIFANKDVTNPRELKRLLAKGRWYLREVEAITGLAKYRHLKKAYYDEEDVAFRVKALRNQLAEDSK
eukprot:CAMPEP_0119124662 /NCGR_PEP_ID=MMETSP1310-20130426/4223_1 /TAXON_ID=464262 /ORGANISM="Genus nov. species nov., Strain RCC2339" /LENGTH=98 /DNA_ID=CAMNT_0007114651 /DNA_START=108 /DNA_END=401 /DNA_ORIENTATION=-